MPGGEVKFVEVTVNVGVPFTAGVYKADTTESAQ